MLTDRTVLITGAARGLGREIAVAAAAEGARLVLSDVNEDGGMATATAIERSGGRARFVACDLSEPAAIETLAKDIAGTEGRLDGLVNNGAIATGIGGKSHDEVDIDTWDRVMTVNVRGLWLMIRATVPLLAKSASARIVNLASDTALWGAPKLLPYVASKGAVISMTRSLARELGPSGIGVVAVAPGILTTESTEYVPAERHAHYRDNRAVPGPQDAGDITGTVLFLLSEPALALTGQALPANRGFCFT